MLATIGRVFAASCSARPGILLGVVMAMNQTVGLMLDTTLAAICVPPKIAFFRS